MVRQRTLVFLGCAALASACADGDASRSPWQPTGASAGTDSDATGTTGGLTGEETGGGEGFGSSSDGTTTGATTGNTTTGATSDASTTSTTGTTDPTTAGTTGTTGAMPDEVCYPGPNEDWTVCYPLVYLNPVPAAYQYPAAYQNNPNYREPVAFIDLSTINSADKVAPNFAIGELAQESKGTYAIVQPHAVEQIQDLRDMLGAITVNSGYRSPGYNAGIAGSATYSRHMYGDAFDLDPINATLTQLENACSASGGMLVEYNTHVHCDWRFDPVAVEFFGKEEDWMPLMPGLGFAASLEPQGMVWTAPVLGFDEGEPTRRWTAYGPDDVVLETARGEEFVPPPGTVKVAVEIGRVLYLSSDN